MANVRRIGRTPPAGTVNSLISDRTSLPSKLKVAGAGTYESAPTAMPPSGPRTNTVPGPFGRTRS